MLAFKSVSKCFALGIVGVGVSLGLSLTPVMAKDIPTPTITKAKRFENDLNANIIISFSLEIGLLTALEPF